MALTRLVINDTKNKKAMEYAAKGETVYAFSEGGSETEAGIFSPEWEEGVVFALSGKPKTLASMLKILGVTLDAITIITRSKPWLPTIQCVYANGVATERTDFLLKEK